MAGEGEGERGVIPRALWWTLFGLALLDFVWNTVAFFFNPPHWHRDVVIVDLLTVTLTAHRLAYPPKVNGGAA